MLYSTLICKLPTIRDLFNHISKHNLCFVTNVTFLIYKLIFTCEKNSIPSLAHGKINILYK